jgi:hypothetical protein
MTTDPLRHPDPDGGPGASPDERELDLPPAPRLRRCGIVRDVGTGPWIGTLACCTRPVGHDGPHAMSLGDPGSPSYWEERWS